MAVRSLSSVATPTTNAISSTFKRYWVFSGYKEARQSVRVFLVEGPFLATNGFGFTLEALR